MKPDTHNSESIDMYMTNFWAVDTAEIVEHLQTEQNIELAWIEQQRNWQAKLASMNPKARYRAKNKSLLRHKQAMRRAAELNAIPSWIADEHEALILHRHQKAVQMEIWTGEPHEVHHIVALHGECEVTGDHVVCGLHVPWNLEVLTRDENRELGAVVSRDSLRSDVFDPFSFEPDNGDNEIPF